MIISGTTAVEFLFPCLNESVALPDVLRRLPLGVSALVVDNGSTDGTASVARAAGAGVVVEPERGYGAAVTAGLRASTADIVAVMDGDDSVRPDEIGALVDAVVAGTCDLALGRRCPVGPGAWPWPARVGNAVLAAAVSRYTGSIRLRDLAPVRVARRESLLALGVDDRRSGLPVETLLRAALAHWRIAEFDVPYHPRAAGTKSKVTGTVRGTVTALRDIADAARRVRVSRDRVATPGPA